MTDVRAEQIAQDSGFSSLLYRLHLTGRRACRRRVIVKLPAQSEARGAMELLGGYRRELAFYRDVAGRAPMETPHVYAARMVEGSVDFVLVLEDLTRLGQRRPPGGPVDGPGPRLSSAQLAGLHAWSVRSERRCAGAFPSIDTPIARDLLLPAFGPGWQIYREKSSAPVPPRSRASPNGSPSARSRRCRR